MPEKRRYRDQRGRDRTPRRINQNSIMNLKPYRNEVVTAEDKNVQMWNKTMTAIGIVLLLVASAIIAWKVIKWWKEHGFAEHNSALFF